jgi:protein TonB
MTPDVLETRLPPANDRMLTTCFLAALLHGIVILGVTFGAPNDDLNGDEAPGLEVVLVNEQSPAIKSNPKAKYLAQRNNQGSGNTQGPERALIPKSSPAQAERAGMAHGDGTLFRPAGSDLGEESLLATRAPSPRILYFAEAEAAKDPAEQPLLLENRPNLAMNANDDGIELRLRGEARNQLWIAADTRASDVAEYLDGWRRKVERVGTINFPNAARRQKLSGTPVVEVTIGADGKLAAAIIRRSSGHPEIDDAAIRILKLAAPFDPFPRELSAKHDEIRIAYEWQFLGGAAAQGSSVLYAEPGSAAPGAAGPVP